VFLIFMVDFHYSFWRDVISVFTLHKKLSVSFLLHWAK
jgi:hypothetical protein